MDNFKEQDIEDLMIKEIFEHKKGSEFFNKAYENLKKIVEILTNNGFEINERNIDEEIMDEYGEIGFLIVDEKHIKVKAYYYKHLGLKIYAKADTEEGKYIEENVKKILEENGFVDVFIVE